MAYDIFMLSGVVSKLGICKNRLSSFITAVATHMHNENPYHNFCHVVHVLHAVFLVSSPCGPGGAPSACGLPGMPLSR
jgi:hypothetical protein